MKHPYKRFQFTFLYKNRENW